MRRIAFVLSIGVLVCLGAAATVSAEDVRTAANRGLILLEEIAVPDAWERRHDRAALVQIKADLLRRHPQLQRLAGRELVLELRDIAHREIAVGYAGGALDDIWRAHDAAVIQKTAAHSCQGINAIFRSMLAAFGFETRLVELLAQVIEEPGDIVPSPTPASTGSMTPTAREERSSRRPAGATRAASSTSSPSSRRRRSPSRR